MSFKSQLTILSSVASSLIFLSGCAPLDNIETTEELAYKKTAEYFNTSQKNLKISNYKKGIFDTTYRTVYKGVTYNCYIYYAEVNCRQPGAAPF